MTPDRLVALTTGPACTWWVRHVAARLDPLLFRPTNGRLTSLGPPVVPVCTITAIGRWSDRPHAFDLACVPHDGGHLVVASGMGQEKHPAWRYNLEAHPEVEVQVPGERFTARARVLDDAEKRAVWPALQRTIPQLDVYAGRTGRNIRVCHLERLR
jgi:deazaflavin-dependent oxidoreductase (nitroreductase family)